MINELTTTHQQQTKMNINLLNDDSLILIFKRLHLQELLRHRGVCARWQLIIEQLCAGRRSLKLFSAFSNVYQYANDLVNFCREDAEHLKLHLPGDGEDDDLQLALRSPETGRLLGELFPNVTCLVVHLNADSFVHLPALLHSLSPKLTRLSVFGEISGEFAAQQQLAIALCRLQGLRHLELLKEPNYSSNRALVFCSPQFAPIISRLETFALSGFQCDIVQLLGETAGLAQLTLDRLPLEPLQQLLAVNGGNLASSLTHLSVDDLGLDSLVVICESFSNLESLEVGLDDVRLL